MPVAGDRIGCIGILILGILTGKLIVGRVGDLMGCRDRSIDGLLMGDAIGDRPGGRIGVNVE